eukprot:TRINITY_DN8973_c0_g1_i2.p1 TRINITY_DN8973_c0_g1~~TRINITY_DN8973_c0_g1_i2.p1  ORF type:complete len:100 (-),score=8.93 TRINITY_DN8973_c0_g1_i2:91-357(-)
MIQELPADASPDSKKDKKKASKSLISSRRRNSLATSVKEDEAIKVMMPARRRMSLSDKLKHGLRGFRNAVSPEDQADLLHKIEEQPGA